MSKETINVNVGVEQTTTTAVNEGGSESKSVTANAIASGDAETGAGDTTNVASEVTSVLVDSAVTRQQANSAVPCSAGTSVNRAKADALPSARALRIHARRAFTLGVVVVCLVAMTCGLRLTYSAFTAGDYLKGVVVTNDTQSLFASDLLYPYSDDVTTPADQVIAVDPDDDGWCYVTFSIYNCLPADRNVVNMKDVVYTLTVTAEDCENWTVSPTPGQITLLGGRAQTDKFTIKFPEKYLGKASFTAMATVDSKNSPGTTLKRLAARIIPNESVIVENASFDGALVDRYVLDADGNSVETDVANYAAYNYRITVTAKEASIKLTWGNAVDLDYFFDSKFSGGQYNLQIDRANHQAILTLQPGNTVVNFFRHDGAEINSWDGLGISITQAD